METKFIKLSFKILLGGLCIVLLGLSSTGVFADDGISSPQSNTLGRVETKSVPSVVYRNVRRSNYRVIRNWYYSHDFYIGGSFGPSRTYKVYYRVVSYTLEYDVYSATGTFLRHERKNYNNILEEDMRL